MESGGAAARGSSAQEFVISRTFDAPVERMFKAWTEADRLKAWFGPKGFTMPTCKQDLRPGGTFLYCLQSPQGEKMWGKFVYREIAPPARLVFVNSFSDEKAGVTRHPFSPTWPLELLSTITFAAHGAKTTVTVRWATIAPSEVEAQTFKDGHDAMKQGWTGTLDQLRDYLAKP
jgi:uncharacterized protein YndB with AHSA1/START domain